MSANLSTEPVDTSEMLVIHTWFRREFRLAGGVVRGVREGDTARAREVAGHIDFIGRCLHHHHTAEDELAWPILLQRVPDELAPIVLLMESQHERVDALLHEIGEIRARWARTASIGDRNRTADLLDTLYTNLAEHLDAEEERLLPIAARTLTHEEWRAIGRRARQQTRRSELTLTFGMFQHDGDPEALGRMIATAPALVRWALPRLARRAFRRYALRIHGTGSP
jgi:hemerythrin-like domain-containing protein